MQDLACELPRITLLSTSVNKRLLLCVLSLRGRVWRCHSETCSGCIISLTTLTSSSFSAASAVS
jgi:hypothetical protein